MYNILILMYICLYTWYYYTMYVLYSQQHEATKDGNWVKNQIFLSQGFLHIICAPRRSDPASPVLTYIICPNQSSH